MNDDYLSTNIRFVRQLMGLTQAEFAKLLQVPRTTLAHYEYGKNDPHLDFIERLIEIVGMPLKDLRRLDFRAEVNTFQLRKVMAKHVAAKAAR